MKLSRLLCCALSKVEIRPNAFLSRASCSRTTHSLPLEPHPCIMSVDKKIPYDALPTEEAPPSYEAINTATQPVRLLSL